MFSIAASTAETPRGGVNLGHRSRQAIIEEEEEGGEGHVIPSFQNAFNEALLSASVSVLAAQSGELLSCGEISYYHHHALFTFTASGGKPGSKTAKKGRKKLVLFSTGGMRGIN